MLTQRKFDLPTRKTYYVALPALALLVVAAYRVAQTFSMNPSDASRSKAAFWVLQMFFELYVTDCPPRTHRQEHR